MFALVLPVVSNVKTRLCPAALTLTDLTVGGAPGSPARSNMTLYHWPAVVAKVCWMPPGPLPLRSMLFRPLEACQNVPTCSTLTPVTVQPGIDVEPPGTTT